MTTRMTIQQRATRNGQEVVMTGFRGFLARFRPVGAPGAAVGGAVPGDRTAELEAELAAPLALLDDTVAQAAAIRAAAAEEAAARRRAATERAERIVRTAREQAPGTRAETAAGLVARSRADTARMESASLDTVAHLRERALERTPAVAARLVARAVQDVATAAGMAPRTVAAGVVPDGPTPEGQEPGSARAAGGPEPDGAVGEA